MKEAEDPIVPLPTVVGDCTLTDIVVEQASIEVVLKRGPRGDVYKFYGVYMNRSASTFSVLCEEQDETAHLYVLSLDPGERISLIYRTSPGGRGFKMLIKDDKLSVFKKH